MKKTFAPPYSLFFFLALAVLTVVLLISCELGSLVQDPQATDVTDTVYRPIDETTAPAVTTEPQTTALATTAAPITTLPPPVTTAPPSHYHPLTGLPCPSEAAIARPIAFCVRQATATEVSAADLVIEAPTEASATRLSLLGTAHASSFGKLTIASTRPYLAALSHDFFGISVYHGTSDNGYPSTDFLYDTLDLSATDIQRSESALRTAITSRGYQSTIVGAITLPYRLSSLGESAALQGNGASYVSVSFHDASATAFTYDAAKNAYTMRSGTALTLDGGELPTFSNILILFHDATERVTKDGIELTLDTSLGGYGYYVSAGSAVPISWRRDPATSSLRLTDESGAPLTVNRGKTYVGMTTYAYRDELILN